MKTIGIDDVHYHLSVSNTTDVFIIVLDILWLGIELHTQVTIDTVGTIGCGDWRHETWTFTFLSSLCLCSRLLSVAGYRESSSHKMYK